MSDEAYFHLHDFVNKQTFRLGSSNPESTFETPLHPERITVCVVCFHKKIMNLIFEQTVCDANYREILTIVFSLKSLMKNSDFNNTGQQLLPTLFESQ